MGEEEGHRRVEAKGLLHAGVEVGKVGEVGFLDGGALADDIIELLPEFGQLVGVAEELRRCPFYGGAAGIGPWSKRFLFEEAFIIYYIKSIR